MRIGIFGGSFDPVHIEHIRVAQAAVRSLALDRLLIMPAGTPPHKKDKKRAPDFLRLEMCKRAFAHIPSVEVSDYEIAKGDTSYTYLTCRDFRTRYPTAELFWLVGTDMLRDFPTWKNPQSILSDVTLAVCARNEGDGWLKNEQRAFFERFGKTFVVVDYNGADVSSTKLRVLAGAGIDISPYTGEAVARFVKENGVYKIPKADEALALEKPERAEHSLRVAETAAKRAQLLGVDEGRAITAALFHDCAKNVPLNSPLLKDFRLLEEWGNVPAPVVHQFAGAYLAQKVFGVEDEGVLDAVRYHTSGRANMSPLEKLIFLADLIEPARAYPGVEELRGLYEKENRGENGLDECLERSLEETLKHLEKKGEVYFLTVEAYEYIKNNRR